MTARALSYGRSRVGESDSYWADYHWRAGDRSASRRHSLLENSVQASGEEQQPQSRAGVALFGSFRLPVFGFGQEHGRFDFTFQREHVA